MNRALLSLAGLGVALSRAAAAPEHSVPTTALTGPRVSPLDDHCSGLFTDDPRTADPAHSCEPAYATKLGGREVAVVRTTAASTHDGPGTDFDLLWLAIRSEFEGRVAPVRARGGRLEIDCVGGDCSVAGGVYTLSPP